MKKLLVILLLAVAAISCNRDNLGPTILFPITTYCASAGEAIVITIEIREENVLTEVILTAEDLDFMESIPGNIIQEGNGLFSATFMIDPATPDGVYTMSVQAIDEFDNSSTQNLTIKID